MRLTLNGRLVPGFSFSGGSDMAKKQKKAKKPKGGVKK
jgi:hypothetical protein